MREMSHFATTGGEGSSKVSAVPLRRGLVLGLSDRLWLHAGLTQQEIVKIWLAILRGQRVVAELAQRLGDAILDGADKKTGTNFNVRLRLS